MKNKDVVANLHKRIYEQDNDIVQLKIENDRLASEVMRLEDVVSQLKSQLDVNVHSERNGCMHLERTSMIDWAVVAKITKHDMKLPVVVDDKFEYIFGVGIQSSINGEITEASSLVGVTTSGAHKLIDIELVTEAMDDDMLVKIYLSRAYKDMEKELRELIFDGNSMLNGKINSPELHKNQVKNEEIEEKIEVPDDSVDNGGKTSYYQFPSNVRDVDALANWLKLEPSLYNILKSIVRLGRQDHSEELRDRNKIVYYANLQLKFFKDAKK